MSDIKVKTDFTRTIEFLNQQCANYSVFFFKVRQFHYNTQGTEFFRLHEKFEELYGYIEELIDLDSERIIQLASRPYSTMVEFLEHSDIKEKPYTKKMKQEEMLEAVVEDLVLIRDELAKGLVISDNDGDYVTNDMLVAQKNKVDKDIWFFTAMLGKDPVPQNQ
ncbi:Dps family protein [Culicoidibacter larvae]|uniref:Dps family protein n=1 Tax=Culicoidibacter larvae TaxID=2579976 RepID=UPI0018EF6C96|nr:Dps family protein [Culicoidibacter larvae]